MIRIISPVKIAFKVRNTKRNSIPFRLFNIHTARTQCALVLQLKGTKFHNTNCRSIGIGFKSKSPDLNVSVT
ncbi:hypothetical protein SFRURICE_005973, partial [Spodoptera frugiperda]